MKLNKSIISTLIITSIITILPVALGLVFYNQLPEQIPQQYGFNEQVTWTLPKAFGIWVCPFIVLLINIAIILVLNLKVNQEENKVPEKVVYIIGFLIPIISLFVNSLLILKPLGFKPPISTFVIPMISLFFIVIGNYMPKIKQNSFAGLRFPAALKDETIWRKAQRFGGFCLVLTGFIGLVFGFFPIGKFVFAVAFVLLILTVTIYSICVSVKYNKSK